MGLLSCEKGKHKNAFGFRVLGCWVSLRPSGTGELALEMLGLRGKHWGGEEHSSCAIKIKRNRNKTTLGEWEQM